jgi:hypothetical protein
MARNDMRLNERLIGKDVSGAIAAYSSILLNFKGTTRSRLIQSVLCQNSNERRVPLSSTEASSK